MSTRAFLNEMPLLSETFLVPTEQIGIDIHVRNKRRTDIETFSAEKTIVLVHGATFSSGSLYDVPFNGMSFLDFLAGAGFDVYALDVRGYGRSSLPPEMEQPPEENAAAVGTEIGILDLGTVVDYVLARRDLRQVSLFGMSWGGTVVGAYASRFASKVARLALLAPQWLSDAPIPIDTGGPLGAYRFVPVRNAEARWLSTAPESGRATLIPEGWFDQWADYTLAEDPWSTTLSPGRIRASNGPIQDIRDYWRAGRKFYDPADIRMPVLLIHGEWDIDVPIELAKALFNTLKNAPYRTWVEIGEATHLVLLEKNRLLAFDAIGRFFASDFQPETMSMVTSRK